MMPQVLIGMPIYRTVEAVTLLSVSSLCLDHPQLIRRPAKEGIKIAPDTYLDGARNYLAELAIEDDTATHLWFVDADMQIPTNGLPCLLHRHREVVGAWYCSRDGRGTSWNFIPDEDNPKRLRFERIDEVGEGLQEVGGLPMGCTLIEIEVLRRMRDFYGDKYWFRRQGDLGEDVWFALRLREMGISSYLDYNIKCGHQSDLLLTWDLWKRKHDMDERAKTFAINEHMEPQEVTTDVYD